LGLPRNVFALGLTSLFNDFSSEMVFSIFPVFFTSVLRTGAASLGLVDGIAEAASNLFKIYSGHISDRVQRRIPLIAGGYGLSTLTRPLYPLFATVGGALALRFTDRIGKGLRDSPRDAILSLSADRGKLGRAFGYHRAMDTTGAILGPLVAYVLLTRGSRSLTTIFVLAFFIGLIAVATLLFVRDVRAGAGGRRLTLAGAFTALPARFRLLLVAVFILSCGGLPVAVLLLKTNVLGLALADIPLFYTIYNIAYAAFALPAGRMSDRFSPRLVIPIGYLVLVLGYGALYAADSIRTAAVAFFVLGLFPALTDGVTRAFASSLTAEGERGSALGGINAATGFGALIAGIGGGYLWQHASPAAAFLAATGFIAVGLTTFWFAAGRA
jgi:MFS family permease